MKDYSGFISDLSELISFNSVESASEKDMPFGKGAADALNFFLSVANRMGFKTINYDNYGGEVIFGDTATEEYGVIGHLDVVPAKDGWNTPPFTLTHKNDAYYGRGTLDDKAPMLICLYALKELKEEILPRKKIRLIVGVNEENGWKDVDYIKTKTTLPEYGFSPDGNFPVSYAEKGMAVVKFYLPLLKNFSQITGGTVINAVCAKASARATADGINESLLFKNKLMLKDNGIIESVGKTCHGSAPEKGVNALKALFYYFADMGEDVISVNKYLFGKENFFAELVSEQGSTTFSPDLIEEKDGKIVISCDCRFPYPFTLADVKKVVDTFGISYSAQEKHPSVCVEKDGEFVKVLLNAYNEAKNETAEPLSMSGSTFARAFKKGVAFGPEFADSASAAHEANECITEKEIALCFEIYKKAIYSLIK